MQLVPLCKTNRTLYHTQEPQLTPYQSGTCVPNTAKFPLLAPIFNPDVCSWWSERWEVRTTPLGCHVSTITLLTCIISVLSTFVVIGLAAVVIKASGWFVPRWKARPSGWWKLWKYYHPGWWRGWKIELIDSPRNIAGEIAPSLG